MAKEILSPIEKVIKALTAAKEGSEKILKDTEFHNAILFIGAGLDKILNRLHFMAGTSPANSQITEFPPVTNFMGEDITIRKPIIVEDLNPEEAELQLYIAKVDKLDAELDTLSPEGIINGYTLPEDQLVIRGVAKRNGVPGYEEEDITVAFIGKIIKAKKKKADDAAEQAKIDEELQKQANKQTQE